MANSKISELPAGAPALGTDEFVIARSGFNFKLTTDDLATFIGSGGSIATTDLTDVSAVAPTQTGELLIFNSVSGNYEPSLILDGGLF
jgi:ABC-type proline/glycine betaine transport system ATPase subunit